MSNRYFCSFYFLVIGNKTAMISHENPTLQNPALNHFINKHSEVEQLNQIVIIFNVLSRFMGLPSLK